MAKSNFVIEVEQSVGHGDGRGTAFPIMDRSRLCGSHDWVAMSEIISPIS